ncbi:MAG: hypothetical protein MZV70_63890 [Desulfobacterales bacterium]|nr:hypothetical protein [Desulfobacterales bacterium]
MVALPGGVGPRRARREDRVIGEECGDAARMDEDYGLPRQPTGLRVVDQSGHRLAGVYGVEEDPLRRGHQANRADARPCRHPVPLAEVSIGNVDLFPCEDEVEAEQLRRLAHQRSAM